MEGETMIRPRETIFLGLIDGVRAALDDEGTMRMGDELVRTLGSLFAFASHVREHEGMPDGMRPGWNRPAAASTADVARALIDAAAHVTARDSFEGMIVWTIPEDDEHDLDGAEYGLMARYRVGNRDGQGGMRVFEGSS